MSMEEGTVMRRFLHRVSWIAWGFAMFFVWRKRCGYWDWQASWAAITMPCMDACQCPACKGKKV